MPVPVAGIVIGIATFAANLLGYLTPYLIGWVMTSVGVGTVTYFGMDLAVDYVVGRVSIAWSGIPSAALELLRLTGIIKAFNIFVGGVTAGLTVKFASWNLSRVRKFRLKA